jgi:hypothetical protein
MNQPTSIILCSTYHDPQFRLKSLLTSALPKIKSIFSKLTVCCTPATPDEVLKFLIKEDFEVVAGLRMIQVDNYKTAIKLALDQIVSPENEKIFYCDFDRLIHWINTYPDELAKTLKNNSDVEYLHIGRTQRAFSSHPVTQKETEIMVNELGSRILGFSETRDLISVCFLFTKDLGEKILKIKNTTKTGFYGIWPVIFWSSTNQRRYVENDGLEWETPDQFLPEISNIGYEDWLKKFQTPNEWKKRVQLLHDVLLELTEIGNFQNILSD